jgi:hypothetical protein
VGRDGVVAARVVAYEDAPFVAAVHVAGYEVQLLAFGGAQEPEIAHSGSLAAEFVREFPDLPRVEGIAITTGGCFFYVTDEDEGVHLRLTRLLAD